jgi:heavy metal translocating P-type ATPase
VLSANLEKAKILTQKTVEMITLTDKQEQTSVCALCESPIRTTIYKDQEQVFCCAGCHAVYQILLSQKALGQGRHHPLFQQALKCGLISNPDIIEQVRHHDLNVSEEEFEKLHLEIGEMWCPSCAKIIRLLLLQEKGIRQCTVDYSTDLAAIEYTPRYISKEKIFQLITALGYHPAPLQDVRKEAFTKSLYLRFIVAAFFSLNIMMFAYPIYATYFDSDSTDYAHLFAWLSFWGALPVLTYSAWPIWRRFFSAMRARVWGMETLVVIGVITATALSTYELARGSPHVYFDSMSAIIVFVLLGKIVESKAKFSAKESLFRLTRALPRRGRKRLNDGSEQFFPLKEIEPGDLLVALTGEKIVLDGIIVEGNGACDESIMTGESLPQFKSVGSSVLAGSFLQQGRLVIKVTARAEETALHRIIQMVEQDIDHKSIYVRAADQIVKWFVPIILILAFSTALYCWALGVMDGSHTVAQTALIRAMSVLLISCPCAIGIAAPLAEAYLLNGLARLGAIVRNRGALPFLGKETVFIFDKTGTLTEGKFTVLQGLESLPLKEARCLKGMVNYSTHPVSVAINQSLSETPLPLDQVEEIAGRGLRAVYNQEVYYLGSEVFLRQQGVSFIKQENKDLNHIKTRVFFAKNQMCLSEIVLGDRLRSGAKELIASLQVKTFLISGDSPLAVQAAAEQCNISEWKGGCHPLQKKEIVESLKKEGHIVAMMGDGINDAPALTASHIGIAVVSATDISVQVSDLLLTTDHLEVITKLKKLARQGHRIIKQNLFWAFFYNVIGVGLAMKGVLSPLFAAFAMIASSLIVLLNAQRIK